MMKNYFSGNSQFLKKLNQSLIMNIVKDHEPIPRNRIAKMMKLSATAVSNLTENLIREGYLREKEPEDVKGASAGRRPIPLELDNNSLFVVGIDLERIDALAAVLTDLRARVIQRIVMPLEKKDPHYVADTILRVVKDLCARGGIAAEKIKGIGIGAPGIIDYHKGTVHYSIRLNWRDVPLEALIRAQLDVPVLVDSGSNVAILGERWQGTLMGIENLVYVNHRIGLGAGFTIHGEIYHGISGTAGEIGHFTIDPLGPQCVCGNKGCLEAIASETALVQRANEALQEGRETILRKPIDRPSAEVTAEALYAAARQGDPLCVGLVQENARNLGVGLANLVNLLNPEMIVISGDIMETGDIFFRTLQESVASHAIDRSAQAVRIMPSTLGRDDVLIGAASLVLDHVFQIPEVRLDLLQKGVAGHAVPATAHVELSGLSPQSRRNE